MKKQTGFIFALLLFITSVFFYPIFKGYVPFPGDALVDTNPYSTKSILGYAPGGVPSKGQGGDIMHEAYPWKYFVISSLKNLQIPFWTPYNFSGNPVMANFQSAVFYPLNFIYFLLPFNTAWTIFLFLVPLLAAFFTYLFLRELKLSAIASLFGGIAFGFCSYFVVLLEYGNNTHTLLWLPLALLFTEKLTKQFTRRNCLFLLFSLWMSLLAGYIQGYFYVGVTVALYFLFKYFLAKKIKKGILEILFVLFLIVAPFALSLFQLLPTLDLFQASSRGNYTLSQIQTLLNPIWYWITVLVPDFFGNPGVGNFWFNGTYIERVSYFGLIPLVFALVALFSFKKRKETLFFGTVFLFTFLIASDLFVTKYLYLIPIPMISTTVPTRILGVFEFCGSILAAFGMEFFLEKKQKRQFSVTIMLVGAILFFTWVFTFIAVKLFPQSTWIQYLPITKHNLIIPTASFLVFLSSFFLQFNFKKLFKVFRINMQSSVVIILFVVTILDLFYFFHKITPFSPKEFIYPQTDIISYLQKNAGIDRFWGYGTGYINSNFQTYDHTFSPEGEDPLHIRWYTELLAASKDGKIPDVLPRPDANIAKGYGIDELKNNLFRQKVLNIDGVKYVLYKDELLSDSFTANTDTFPLTKYRLIWQQKPWQVYQNLQVVPRYFLTNQYLVIPDKNKTLQIIFSPKFDERRTLLLDADPMLQTGLTKKTVNLISYQPNSISFTTHTDADALLFLSDTYYKSWEASIDAKATNVYLADYAFRAVKVPSGDHTVTFYQSTKLFSIGVISSAIFAVLLGVFFLFGFRKLYENKKL